MEAKTLTPEEVAARKTRYEELYVKDEKTLTEEETKELLSLSEELQGVETPEKVDDSKEEGTPPAEPKKYAGKYETVEDLLKGVNSSEEERKRIASELTEDQIREIEDGYKDSQRKVTKLVQAKRTPVLGKAPLQERRLAEMTKEEYEAWEKEDKLAAQSWLATASSLNESQKKSAQKVYDKHPEFFAMLHGVKAPNKEMEVYDRICLEHPEWTRLPNGPELALEAMEAELGKAPKEETPKPKKEEEKPGFADATGKQKGNKVVGKSKLTAQEFEALSPEQQTAYLESQAT